MDTSSVSPQETFANEDAVGKTTICEDSTTAKTGNAMKSGTGTNTTVTSASEENEALYRTANGAERTRLDDRQDASHHGGWNRIGSDKAAVPLLPRDDQTQVIGGCGDSKVPFGDVTNSLIKYRMQIGGGGGGGRYSLESNMGGGGSSRRVHDLAHSSTGPSGQNRPMRSPRRREVDECSPHHLSWVSAQSRLCPPPASLQLRGGPPHVSSDLGSPVRSRAVSFGPIQVRSYQRVLGDNPSCSSGPPVSLGWKYREERAPHYRSVELYEQYKRENNKYLVILSREEREHILSREGYRANDLAEAVRQTRKVKNQRRQTVNNLDVMGVEETAERVKKTFKRVILRKTFRSRHLYDEWRSSKTVTTVTVVEGGVQKKRC